jgi:hypothetical protein
VRPRREAPVSSVDTLAALSTSATVLSPGHFDRNVQEYFSRTSCIVGISILLGARLSAM